MSGKRALFEHHAVGFPLKIGLPTGENQDSAWAGVAFGAFFLR